MRTNARRHHEKERGRQTKHTVVVAAPRSPNHPTCTHRVFFVAVEEFFRRGCIGRTYAAQDQDKTTNGAKEIIRRPQGYSLSCPHSPTAQCSIARTPFDVWPAKKKSRAAAHLNPPHGRDDESDDTSAPPLLLHARMRIEPGTAYIHELTSISSRARAWGSSY